MNSKPASQDNGSNRKPIEQQVVAQKKDPSEDVSTAKILSHMVKKLFELLKILLVFSVLLALLYAGLRLLGFPWFGSPSNNRNLAAILFSLGFFCIGGLLGFLFGIPRSKARNFSNGNSEEDKRSNLEPNTNLEQVSDWLTKIIVGVTLVQLHEIPALLNNFSSFAGSAFGNNIRLVPGVVIGTGGATAVASLLFFSADGFLVGYLVTRLILQGAFNEADSELREEFGKVKEQIDKVREVVEQKDTRFKTVAEQVVEDRNTESGQRIKQQDLDAYKVAQAYLYLPGPPVQSQERDVDNALKEASATAKEQIFRMCRAERTRATEPPNQTEDVSKNQNKLLRAVDVLKSLQEADGAYAKDFRVFAEIGYAYEGLGRLPDQKVGFDSLAAEALSSAITFRDGNEAGIKFPFPYYECYRAIVNIRRKQKDDLIKKDLGVALRYAELEEELDSINEVTGWLKEKGLTFDDLRAPPDP